METIVWVNLDKTLLLPKKYGKVTYLGLERFVLAQGGRLRWEVSYNKKFRSIYKFTIDFPKERITIERAGYNPHRVYYNCMLGLCIFLKASLSQ